MKNILLSIFGGLALTTIQAQTFSGTGGAINDLATNDFSLTVSGLSPATIDTTNFGLMQVCVNLTHTYDADLQIRIIAPDGTSGMLVSGVGGGGDNFTNTCFNQNASTAIAAGSPPFTGTFKPQGMMGLVNNGQNGNGVWKLRVIDMAGGDVGNVISWSITFGNNPATYISLQSSNLPIVVINTNNQTIPNEPKIMADMGIIYNGTGNRNYMTDPFNHYNGKIGIEIRGNYSASLPQKPYAIELWDVNGNPIDSSILGMPAENDWCLIACYNDKSFVRNLLSYHLFESMGHYATRSQFVEAVVNGEYQGIYMFCETIKRDANRVDISKLDPTEIYPPNVTGGYIIKTDYWDNTNSWLSNYHPINHPTFDVHHVYVYPDAVSIVPQQKTYIQTFMNNFETALYSSTFTDTTNGYRKYISVRSWYDYFIISELSRNVDGYKKSRYYYKEKDSNTGALGKLKAGPVWDFDWAWKDIWDCTIFQQTDGSGWSYNINDCNPDVYSPGYYVRLLQDTLFANELNCRYTELRGTILDTTYLFNYIDSMANYLNEAQARHFAYWGNMGVATGTPEIQPPSQTYAEEVQKLKDWITRRVTWLDANFPGNSNNCNLTGISEHQDNSGCSAFPNPFANEINIQMQLKRGEQVTVRMYDMNGREVIAQRSFTGYSGQNLFTMEMPEIPAGLYLLRIQAREQIITKRIAKN